MSPGDRALPGDLIGFDVLGDVDVDAADLPPERWYGPVVPRMSAMFHPAER
ncbi:hypothetical protein [Cellulomonas sp. NS3]|uniref:hypothetical protein n=1 Tax=Cellulomonas sp. NS3 TaxID=2973977 RepID=UPI002161445F|nr:hypothetical protein [Cellulomonas sp. NS3]